MNSRFGKFLCLLALPLIVAPAMGAKKTAAPAPAVATPAREYDFRGTALGVSLADFVKLPFPDADLPQGKVVCSSDPNLDSYKGIDLSLSPYEKAASVTKCAYFSESTVSAGYWAPAVVRVGTSGFSTFDLTYSFVVDPRDHVSKLYSIIYRMVNLAAPTTLTGLQEKFGVPTSLKSDTVQNGAGANFPRTTALWVNPLSTLLFQSPFGELNQMAVVYNETRLTAYVVGVKEKIQGPESSKL